MSLFNLFSRIPEVREESPPTQPPAGSGVLPPSRSAGVSLSSSTATGLIGVYRAVQILSTAAAQLSLDAYRGDTRIDRPLVLRSPSDLMPLSAFLGTTVTSMALHGNAFWKINRTSKSASLELLNPLVCTLDPVTLELTVGLADGKALKLAKGEYAHMALMRRPGYATGLGPIQSAQTALQGAMDLDAYASGFFASGDTPTGILTSDSQLADEEAAEIKANWATRDAHNIAVLGYGMHFEPTMISPRDAQFIESRQYATGDIARLFGIPPHLMSVSNDGQSLTYQNTQQADMQFIRWTLSSYLIEIESAFSQILPLGTVAKFNMDAFLRPDISTRYAAYATGITAGFLTIDEVRAQENLS